MRDRTNTGWTPQPAHPVTPMTTEPDRPIDLIDPKQVFRRGRAPGGLWLRGTLPPVDRLRVGLIGSRAATGEQLEVTRLLAATLAQGGACVVSGGARGVDAQALTTAITAGAATMAVLPRKCNRVSE